MRPPPPGSTLFPYPTPFRSHPGLGQQHECGRGAFDPVRERLGVGRGGRQRPDRRRGRADRKSTRLNSSHLGISYAVFCSKKKKKKYQTLIITPTSMLL